MVPKLNPATPVLVTNICILKISIDVKSPEAYTPKEDAAIMIIIEIPVYQPSLILILALSALIRFIFLANVSKVTIPTNVPKLKLDTTRYKIETFPKFLNNKKDRQKIIALIKILIEILFITFSFNSFISNLMKEKGR